ncbi:MAG: hypothetical protein IPH28_20675 [Cytophagaceae bacterium]|nr:hypothetical protein [Cytophagaceae bacterium]
MYVDFNPSSITHLNQPKKKYEYAKIRNRHIRISKRIRKFPYFIVKAPNTVFFQIPIHFVDVNDKNKYEGKVITDFPYKDIDLSIDEIADEWVDRLIKEAEIEYQKQCINFKREMPVCLVLNPDTAYYINKEGKSFFPHPPSGGTLRTLHGFDIKTQHGQHYLYSELEKFKNQIEIA